MQAIFLGHSSNLEADPVLLLAVTVIPCAGPPRGVALTADHGTGR
jgi:hypothetical protein